MSPIQTTQVVTQAQLNQTAEPPFVTVSYPIGMTTVLSVQPDGSVQTRPQGTEGPWERATVLANGNLLFSGSGTPYAVLGASLKPL